MASIADDGDMTWLTNACLSIVVIGASGDLAKKKTYPSLLNLFVDKLLPKDTHIIGYARSDMSDDDLRGRLRPYLEKSKHSEENIENFLKICFYQGGKSYGDTDAFGNLKSTMESYEKENDGVKEANRLFYFAIPPNVFGETAVAIKKSCTQVEGAFLLSRSVVTWLSFFVVWVLSPVVSSSSRSSKTEKGWTRLIVEKPFGRDLQSFEELNKTLSEHFTEEHLYRIDHYLVRISPLTALVPYRSGELWNTCADRFVFVHVDRVKRWCKISPCCGSPTFGLTAFGTPTTLNV
eukprot:scaffold34607_cov177-Amphora_coffeaeformis.AAC.4